MDVDSQRLVTFVLAKGPGFTLPQQDPVNNDTINSFLQRPTDMTTIEVFKTDGSSRAPDFDLLRRNKTLLLGTPITKQFA